MRTKEKPSRTFSKISSIVQESKLSSPLSLRAIAGNMKGEVDLVWEPIEGAKSYVIQKCSGIIEPNNWKREDTISKSSYTVSNLQKGKHWFRIAALGRKGLGPWSYTVQKKVR